MSDQQPIKNPSILVGGIVSHRDGLPYVQVDFDGKLLQMSMGQARSIAFDLLRACGYAEADAMILRFFDANHFPKNAAGALMIQFRDFRAKLDSENVERFNVDPDD